MPTMVSSQQEESEDDEEIVVGLRSKISRLSDFLGLKEICNYKHDIHHHYLKQCNENHQLFCNRKKMFLQRETKMIRGRRRMITGNGYSNKTSRKQKSVEEVARIKQKRGFKDQWHHKIKMHTDHNGKSKGMLSFHTKLLLFSLADSETFELMIGGDIKSVLRWQKSLHQELQPHSAICSGVMMMIKMGRCGIWIAEPERVSLVSSGSSSELDS